MKKLLFLVLIVGFLFWVYKVPLHGQLPKLTHIKPASIMKITSTAFTNNGTIPDRYTCSGDNVNPELEFSGITPDAQSLALIVDDPDAPTGTFTHWVIFNIPPTTKSIVDGGSLLAGNIPGVQAKNSAGVRQYTGPCPPTGTHRYYFKLYALDVMLEPDTIPDKSHLVDAMAGHILDETELLGKFSKTE